MSDPGPVEPPAEAEARASSLRAPRSIDAERDLLGAMLTSRPATEAGLELCAVGDFFHPEHQRVFAAIARCWEDGKAIDPTSVADALSPLGASDKDRRAAKERLVALQAQMPPSGNAQGWALVVQRHARYRRAILFADELRQAAYAAPADAGASLDALLASADDQLAAPVIETADATELDDLLASPDPVAKPWVIPGLMQAQDVTVLTGGEGSGKMTVARQAAIGAAAGIHPFTELPMRRSQVLIVDLQEDLTDLRRELARPRAHVGGHYQKGAVHLVSRRQGINLLGAHDARWFEGLLARVKPGLVVMGPLKKMYQPPAGKGIWDDDVVEALHRRLDEWIVRFGFALWLEGHAGHDRDTWRVKGSSAWYAWPHFGYGIDTDPQRGNSWRPRSFALVRWRGDRENGVPRHWPLRIREREQGFLWSADGESVDAMREVQRRGNVADQPTLSEGDPDGPF